MKKNILILILSVFYLFPACAKESVSGELKGETGTYRTHEQMIKMYRDECDKYPEVASAEVIGQTTQDNDIWAFRIGNPDGAKIIIDGCLHGWEDLGSEIAFIWIKWLLESNTPKAQKILQETCWIVIPVINFDTYDRGNMNRKVCSGGVDLNRNFLKNWVFVPECDGPFGTSHGASAASEKETQVIRAFMEANKPTGNQKFVYISTHYGGGPWIHYDGKNTADYYLPIRNKIMDNWNSAGIVLKNVTIGQFLPETTKNAVPGGAAGDATDFGYEAFTVEVMGRSCRNSHKFAPLDAPCGTQGSGANHPSFDLVQNELYPIFKPFFLAVCESVASGLERTN